MTLKEKIMAKTVTIKGKKFEVPVDTIQEANNEI